MTTRCQHRHVNNDATTTPTPHHVKMQDGRFTTHPTCRRTKHASSPQHTTTTRSSMTPPLPPLHFEARDGVQSPWRGRAYQVCLQFIFFFIFTDTTYRTMRHITSETLRTDGLNNHYVQIVHVNGIHHLALVTCSCLRHENIPLDLMFSRLVLTSFVRFRTLFTVAVLDHFRLSNLELKSSAYQYFHFLQRLTMPTTPTKVINFYHELR